LKATHAAKPKAKEVVSEGKKSIESGREKLERERFGVDEVATTEADDYEGETRNSRLQGFLSSLLSSFGGVFGYNTQEQEQEKEMASRAIVPSQQPGGTVPSLFVCIFYLLVFVISWFFFCFVLISFELVD
jgi:hypothetical protein